MSHTVNITRTTTTVTTSGFFINTGYFGTLPGILKFFQTILGAVCVGLIASDLVDCRHYYSFSKELFFLIVACTFMIGSLTIVISCLFSISTASYLPKTLFEFIYHLFAFILYLAASITLLATINQYYKYRYDQLLAAGIIGLVNCVLYLISAVFAYRGYKGL